MSEDARFEDGAERPLRLRAESVADLQVISALLQDAVTQTGDIAWLPRWRRFTLLVNRFRWEDAARAERQARPFERVRAIVAFESVLAARTSGVDPRERDLVLSILSVGFEPGPDDGGASGGTVRIVLAGDGEIALDTEALEVSITDVTRPYEAQSTRPPRHADG